MEESARQAQQEERLVFLDRGAVGDTLFAIQNYKVTKPCARSAQCHFHPLYMSSRRGGGGDGGESPLGCRSLLSWATWTMKR